MHRLKSSCTFCAGCPRLNRSLSIVNFVHVKKRKTVYPMILSSGRQNGIFMDPQIYNDLLGIIHRRGTLTPYC